MKSVCVTCVGKLKERYFADAVAEYAKRLNKYCKLTVNEVDDVAHADEVRLESYFIHKTFLA